MLTGDHIATWEQSWRTQRIHAFTDDKRFVCDYPTPRSTLYRWTVLGGPEWFTWEREFDRGVCTSCVVAASDK